MDSKSRFYALEVMCRERARLADKESNYWLAEAEKWARLRLSCHRRGAQRASSSEPTRSTEVKVDGSLPRLGKLPAVPSSASLSAWHSFRLAPPLIRIGQGFC
jgi:hypothetical protein